MAIENPRNDSSEADPHPDLEPVSRSMEAIIASARELIELEERIRKFINIGRHQVQLLKVSNKWNQICSSLDVIGDTVFSVEDYVTTPYPSRDGLRYIYTYGILQALFIQQDAVAHLLEAFDVPYSPSKELMEAREIRNSAIGHPTKQNLRKKWHFNYVSRITLSKSGFTLLRASDGSDQFVDVDLMSMIQMQFDEVAKILTALQTKLNEADQMHRDRFKMAPLNEIFHPAAGYLFEKVSEGIHSPSASNTHFGLSMLLSIEEMYAKFRRALEERRELNSYIDYDLKEYEHAIHKLKSYLSDNQTDAFVETDARIYVFYLRQQHQYFTELAAEIDAGYQES
jgi:hypothetical protein